MGNDVFANGREISCKAADGKSICAFPDVCFTPPQCPATPPGVPVPYPNTGFAKDTTSGSKSVKITGKEVMLKNKSYFKKSTGDEAGCAPKKGVVTSVNRGKVYFTSWSMDVKVENENVVRHLDMTTHNHGSNPNTGPWPYADDAVVGPGGACSDESIAIKNSNKCKEPIEQDISADCCSVPERKCVMVPYSKQKKWCCFGQQTGHHPVPVQEFHEAGDRGGKLLPGLENRCTYKEGEAPTVCVEGNYHREWENVTPYTLKEHGKLGNAYIAERLNRGIKNNQNDVKYEQLASAGAASVEFVFKQCSSGCIKKQLDIYHVDSAEIPPNEEVCRASQQGKQKEKRKEIRPPPIKKIKTKK